MRAAETPVTLSSPLLSTDDTLKQVAAGTLTLGTGAKGQAVERMQRALIGAGYPLPGYGPDGDFGPQTRGALTSFQQSNGLEADGVLDATTLGVLDAKGGAAGTRYPEYGKLFQDGVLNATIAVGYDEDGSDLAEVPQVRAGLQQRGFQPLDVKNLDNPQLEELGLDPSKIDRDGEYWTKSFDAGGKRVLAAVQLIDRASPEAKQQFQAAMSNAELLVYSGHARYGTGPDFDPIDSPAGNYVIGDTYSPGHVVFGSNDLAKTKLTDGYQLMVFDACRTRDYLDDLRSIPKNKNASNLDLVLSDDLVNWGDGTANVFTALDGVMQQKSIDELQSRFESINHVGFDADGFLGNTWRPA
jgi:peptidoglycan hydrolase-like protein with peptidoglycan-binding domain